MLFLIASPIGNLKDVTHRAIEAIQACDYLLCEDTRHTKNLLNHYGLKAVLKSFHQFNEAAKEDGIICDLKKGLKIGLISDAGTPGISDPGERLIKRCREETLLVIPIPGPCAAISALSASGLKTERFQFVGFLPRKKGKLKKLFEEILTYKGTTICYESPYRLIKTLQFIAELAPERECSVAREMTKKFEVFVRGTPQSLLASFADKTPKGEIVLLISGEIEA
jgi:16S rRNA (cytidine1402-2'-O)-methyltransferase